MEFWALPYISLSNDAYEGFLNYHLLSLLFTLDPANYHDSEVPEEAKTLAHVSEQNFTTIFGMEMLRG